MRKALLLLLLALAAMPAWAASSKSYTNPEFLYAVDYPETWHLRELGKAVTISSPKESELDKFSENVQIVAEDLRAFPDVTLMDYHKKGSENARKFLTDFRSLEEARTEWLDRETVVMLYTATVHGERYKFKDYKFMLGRTAYVLTYTAREADFDSYLTQAENIMRSLRVSP